jgi:hypothetical protein
VGERRKFLWIAQKHTRNTSCIELSGKVLEKLNGMSDEEFARIDLTAAE